jgi:ATP-dependent RNA helicase DeaD
MTLFSDLGLSESTLAAITKKGFEEPTEIQAKAIPLLLESDKDIIAQAQTGTGKTAAFGLVFTDKLTPGKQKAPQAIVLAPTRELAVQISEELNSLKGEKRLSIIPVYGGQSFSLQQRHLRQGVDIVVGTPGRIMDHLDRGTLKIDKIEYFVLDEADEMLNMGFIEDIEKILTYAPKERKVLLFSATMPRRISDLAKKYMKDPIMLKTKTEDIANNKVDQIYFEVSERDKFEALCRIVDMEDDFYGIVFCRTKVDSDRVAKSLGDRGYSSEAFHGDISQDRREKILKNFKQRKTEILVATDVAARGIDVQDLTHVINYSLPQNSESYVHRIGRTGRAGKDGKAITLITPSESRKLRMFEHRAKATITKQVLPKPADLVEVKKQKILQELSTILESEKTLESYKVMATELLASGIEAKDMIAAILQHSFAESLDINSYQEIRESKSRASDRNNGREDSRGGRREEYGQTRLVLAHGRKDGAHPKQIVEMLEKEFKTHKRKVGDIDIFDTHTVVSVPLREAEVILEKYQAYKNNNSANLHVKKDETNATSSRPRSGGGGGYRGGGGGSRGGSTRSSGGRSNSDRGGRSGGGGRR